MRIEGFCFRALGPVFIQIALAPSSLVDPCNLDLVGSRNVASKFLLLARVDALRRAVAWAISRMLIAAKAAEILAVTSINQKRHDGEPSNPKA